tara:strand:+ start:329 stop:760 length:432 start_codon:yes stop_codon:yes gene_type:complete
MPFQKPSTSKSTNLTRRQRGRHADVPKPLQSAHERSVENQAKTTTNGGVNNKKSMSGYKQIRQMRYDFEIKGDGPLYDDEDDFGDISPGSRKLSDEEIKLLSRTEEDDLSQGTTWGGQWFSVGAIFLFILAVVLISLGATGTI